jgi:hypothetical protein
MNNIKNTGLTNKKISKGKTLWDIIIELKGTEKRKSFFDWLIKG